MAVKKKAAKAKKATKKSTKKASSKRELIAPRGDKRYVRRSKTGQFIESDDQGRSLSRDVRQKAKTIVKAGQGDKGRPEIKTAGLDMSVHAPPVRFACN